MEWNEAFHRRCRRCSEWLPLTEFKPHAVLCGGCVPVTGEYKRTAGMGKARGYALTDKAHAAIKNWPAVKVAS